MRYFLGLALALFCMTMISCDKDSDEVSCTQADWIGTYLIDESMSSCEDPSVSLSDMLVITAGPSDTELDYDGTIVDFDECTVEIVFFGSIRSELSGDQITVNGLGCEGIYNRQ